MGAPRRPIGFALEDRVDRERLFPLGYSQKFVPSTTRYPDVLEAQA
jgi:hypothetical protein